MYGIQIGNKLFLLSLNTKKGKYYGWDFKEELKQYLVVPRSFYVSDHS